MADGTIRIDTKIDDGTLKSDLQKLAGAVGVSVAAIGAALSAAGAQAVQMGMSFTAGMSQVQAISGATGADLDALRAKALEMGATTQFSATQSAEALLYMGMAGWDAQQMIDGLPGVMNLAAASGESLGLVSDIVTDALTAMGLKAEDAGHFADVLATAAASSNTNVSMMGQTFKYAAPLAGALGFSIEDLSVAIGLMANAGIKGEQAGTTLRAMLTRLASPTDEVAALMRTLGISITNTDGTMRPLNDILVDMRASFSGLSEAEQANAAATLAGQEAMSGMLAIVNASDEDFNNLTAAVNDASGAAEEMARVMNDNLTGDMVLLESALEGLGIQIFESFETPLREAAQAATEAVDQIAQAFATPEMEAALGTVAEALSGLVVAIAEFLADAIPAIVDGLATAIEFVDRFSGVLLAGAAAFAAYKAGAVITAVVQGIGAAMQKAAAAATANTAATAANAAAQKASATASATAAAAKTGKAAAEGATTAATATNTAATAANTASTAASATASVADAAAKTAQGTAAAATAVKVNLLTVAQGALNTMMKASPVGMAMAALAGFVAVAESVRVAITSVSEEMQALRERTRELSEELRNLHSATFDSSNAYFQTQNALIENRISAHALLNELQELRDATEQSAESQQRQKGILTELRALYPDLTLEIGQTTEEMRALLEVENAALQLDAANSRQEQLRREIENNTALMQSLLEQKETLEHEFATATGQRWNDLKAEIDDINHQIGNLEVEMEGAGQRMIRTTEDIMDAEEAYADAAEAANAILERKAQVMTSVSNLYNPAIEGAHAAAESAQELAEALREETSAYEESGQAIETEGAKIESLISQYEGLMGVSGRTDEQQAGLLATIVSLGAAIPEVNERIDEQTGLLSLTGDELRVLSELYTAQLEKARTGEEITRITDAQARAAQGLSEVEESLADVRDDKQKIEQALLTAAAAGITAENDLTGAVRAHEEKLAELNEAEQTLMVSHEALQLENEALGASFEQVSEDNRQAAESYAEAMAQYEAMMERQQEVMQAVVDANAPVIESAEAVVTANERITESMDDMDDAFSDALRTIDREADGLRALAGDVEALGEKTGLTALEQAELRDKTAQLVEIIPGLSEFVNEQTGALELGGEAAGRYIDAWANNQRAIVSGEYMTQMLQAQTQATLTMEDAEQALSELRASMLANMERKNELDALGAELTTDQVNELHALTEVLAIQEGLEQALIGSSAELLLAQQGLALVYDETTGVRLVALSELAAAEQDDVDITRETADEKIRLAQEEAEAIAQAQEQMANQMRQSYERYAGMTQNMTDTIKLNTKLSLDDVKANLEENTRVFGHWTDNLSELSGRIDESMLEELRRMGPEFAFLTQEMVDASDEELAELTRLWREGGAEAVRGMQTEFEHGGPAATGAADAIIQEIARGFVESSELDQAAGELMSNILDNAEGVVSGQDFVQLGQQVDADVATGLYGATYSTEAAKSMVDDAKDAAETQEGSADFPSVGAKMDEDVGTGIGDGTQANDAVQALVDGAKDAADTAVAGADFPGTGGAMVQGTADGVAGSTGTLDSAAQSAAASAVNAASGTLNHSAGYTVGSDFGQGMADGISSQEGAVSSAASSLANAAAGASRRALNEHSPSLVMREAGEFFSIGFAEGIEDETDAAVRAAEALSNEVVAAMVREHAFLAAVDFEALDAMGYEAAMASQDRLARSVQGSGSSYSYGGDAVEITVPVTVYVESLNSDADIDALAGAVGRRIGEDIHRQKRWKGVFAGR